MPHCLCPRPESNRHRSKSRGILSPLRLPVSPLGQHCFSRLESESNRRPRLCRPLHDHSATQPVVSSGKRDSNPRPQPWQGCALPLSYSRITNYRCGRIFCQHAICSYLNLSVVMSPLLLKKVMLPLLKIRNRSIHLASTSYDK